MRFVAKYWICPLAGLCFGMWQQSAWAALTMFAVLFLLCEIVGTTVTIYGSEKKEGEWE